MSTKVTISFSGTSGALDVDNSRQSKKDRVRGLWNNKQKQIKKQFFKNHIAKKITPKKHECLQLQENYRDVFKDKS